ncbi:ABC transporter substrate-binding protein [Chelatococcus asaccharovorans]|uniref:ABC transporter substrate-binding protein n=1 Tax=Chelatococcus asaccharovorans TaxID=28210 RepID=UPI00224C6FC0|nr:ABC transporter substrate-binding protein [Chelatococcus asaccharovorans]CAH1663251.1 Amino acid/amide ABC transporter substrate-binding protein, HAAT family [Chelatococcus asaccharovorans]CAH1682874.1 Amino acid/amide ABC transporter substrate-binding protein, HAAT family [Chelatococcus asaccharovorans]
MKLSIKRAIFGSTVALALFATPVMARDGVTDTEVKIGNSVPYSGPASAFGITGRSLTAFFNKVNDEGGIAGRKVKLISLDDAYSPPKAVEATRQLVERDGVLAMFAVLGSANNVAIRNYLNAKKVPQLFTSSGATTLSENPAKYPWTMGWTPTYQTEGAVYGRHILKNFPDAKIAVLYQNDDFGKDYLVGLKNGLGDKANEMLVAVQSYELSDPTVNSQIISLQASGANVFVDITTPKFGAQAIKKVAELGWKPAHYISFVSSSVGSVLAPAGLDNAKGLLTVQFVKDPNDPQWAKDEGFMAWKAFMDKYMPGESQTDPNAVTGFSQAETMKHVLEMAGKDLTRDSLMKAAQNIKDLQLSMFLPGITLNTSPTDYAPVKCLKLAEFNGKSWTVQDELICAE